MVDYLSLTLLDYRTSSTFLATLGVELEPLGFGRHGYREGAVGANVPAVEVYWDGSDGMGSHVRLGGSALRALEVLGVSPADLCSLAADLGARCTRFDWALDTALVGVGDVAALVRAGQVRRYGNRWSVIESDSGASTVYIGARSSMAMMRAYDCAAVHGLEGRVTRLETEFKAERAQVAFRLFVEQGWAAVTGYVRSAFEFLAGADVTNRSRARSAGWWERVCSGAGVLRVSLATAAECSIARCREWVRRQVAGVLRLVSEYEGGDVSWLSEIVSCAKIPPRRRFLLYSGGV